FEAELKLGLRNMWYPVCQADRVKQEPIGLRRLGTDIVVWRDSRGTIHTHEDRCLHRGAKLSLGKVVSDRLRCTYHGWCYDTSGQCVTIPTSKTAQAKLAPRLRLEQFETQERVGLVWVYFPDLESNAAVPRLVIPEELEDPAYSGFICEAEWNANW